jgi:peptide/nickel transport system substrate-binding protein
MPIRAFRLALVAGLFAVAGCGREANGPIRVSAIGGPPQLVNPNVLPLDPAAAYLTEAVAQGLARFDAAGEIEPALAQSWIVSRDGLRYTFRIRRAQWPDGRTVTAQQVAAQLRAALARGSRNPFKPVLGAIDTVTPMTDSVVEIALRGPRPNFLQLLAHPELGLGTGEGGTGPYRLGRADPDGVRLTPLRGEDEESEPHLPDLLLRGDRAAVAVARFACGETDLVLGGTIGDLAIARAADLGSGALLFDPVGGLLGLAFASNQGALADADLRRALAMAIDRDGLAQGLDVPRLAPRTALVAPGVQELPSPLLPDWATLPLAERRDAAARIVAGFGGARIHLRVALPDLPGDRLIFAYLRRDWRMIGVEAERVAPGAPADLLLIDEVAPTNVASWYLRHFTCDASAICDAAADAALQAARVAAAPDERQARLAEAERILTGLVPFIPLTAPVRWSLVTPRLRGFRPNAFARHPAETLLAEEP